MKKEIIYITLIAILGKALGFLREILLANYFGTSIVVDAYLMSVSIPSIFFGFLPALGVGFTPIYYKVDKEDRNRFTTNALLTSMLIALACAIASLLFSHRIVALVAAGFQGEVYLLTVQYFKVTIWLILFNTPIQIMISYLNCNGFYVYGNITNLLLSSTQCVFVIAARHNICILPYGILVSFILQFGLLFFFSISKGYKFFPGKSIDNNIVALYKLSIPIFLSNILVDINGFVDKYFASFLREGSIASLNYAYTIMSLFYYIFTSAITTIYYPKVSQLVERNKIKQAAEITQKIIDLLVVLIIPISFLGILMAKDILYIVLQRGKFDEESLELTAAPFVIYMLALVCISIRDFVNRVLYAFRDSKSNLLYGAICILGNIILSFILIKFWGHIGLAAGTSVAALCTFPLYLLKIQKMLPGLHLKMSLLKGLKAAIASVPIMGIWIWLNNIFGYIFEKGLTIEIIKCITCIVIATPITTICMKVLKIKEADIIIKSIHSVL